MTVPGRAARVGDRVAAAFRGEGAKARTVRSVSWNLMFYGGTRGMRLASNLVLTRLLFPEAFGIMAIVNVVLLGLELFSDTGIKAIIVQNKREDRDFLDTAWTIQVVRGIVLWLLTFAIAWPLAAIYDEPLLAWILPVAGIALLFRGLFPVALHVAVRHLQIGRVTTLELTSQAVGIATMVLLAWLTGSVWGLVLGGVLSKLAYLILLWNFLPGASNRLRWDPSAGWEMIHFGKYIMVSTAFGFILQNSDRLVLGGFVTLATLGVYNIAFFFATVPLDLAHSTRQKVLLSLYRMRPIKESAENRRQIFRLRRMILAGALAGNAVLGLMGPVLIELLYDSRYALAGPIMVLISVGLVSQLVVLGTGEVLLSDGNSRDFMTMLGLQASLYLAFMVAGAWSYGLLGAILGPGLAMLLFTPVRIYYTRPYDAWDGRGDYTGLIVGYAVAALTCWVWRDVLIAAMPELTGA